MTIGKDLQIYTNTYMLMLIQTHKHTYTYILGTQTKYELA